MLLARSLGTARDDEEWPVLAGVSADDEACRRQAAQERRRLGWLCRRAIAPVLSVLVDYCRWIEAEALRCSCTAFRDGVSTVQMLRNLVPVFAALVAEHGLYASFVADCETSGYWFSGSMLLQLLTGERWLDSDLDVYFVCQDGHVSVNVDRDDPHWLTGKLHSLYGDRGTEAYDIFPVRSKNFAIETKGGSRRFVNTVQIYPDDFLRRYAADVPVPVEPLASRPRAASPSTPVTPPDFVAATADMDFLRNSWSGGDQGGHLYVENVDAIWSRSCRLGAEVVRKYMTTNAFTVCSSSGLHRLQMRVDKYRARGYEVELDSDLATTLRDHLAYCDGSSRSVVFDSQVISEDLVRIFAGPDDDDFFPATDDDEQAAEQWLWSKRGELWSKKTRRTHHGRRRRCKHGSVSTAIIQEKKSSR